MSGDSDPSPADRARRPRGQRRGRWPPAGVDSLASGLASGVIVAAAAVPYAGWLIPCAWLAVTSALVFAGHGYLRHASRDGPRPPGALDPFSWLISAAYSAAALYLAFMFTGAAQTLGVTLYGLVMFRILARDYAAPRRLAANLAAPVAALVIVQIYAATRLIELGQPWRIVTLVASPLIVFRVFRAVQENLGAARRQADEALARLAESEARYRVLAESSPDIILRYDTSGRIEYVSPAAAAYGYDPAGIVGRNVAEFVHADDRGRNEVFLRDLAGDRPTPKGAENVWRSWTADGAPLAFEGATSVLRDPDGRVAGALSVLRNVTARVALEDELRARRAEAEAANDAKSQFLANMSHEVRTPLTGVIGFARLLQAMDGLPETAHAYVARIAKSAEALLRVVNDVLDFSRLESGQLDLDPQPIAMAPFLEDTVDLMRQRAAEKHLGLSLVAPADLPAHVEGDAARLRQVLLNLIANAVKFTTEGGVTVTAGYGRGRLRIEVSDTGPGIDPEAAGRLFRRFSQVDDSHTRKHGGAGLGLAICKGLVEMMGGEIGLDSTPGVGSTFWFAVPATVCAAPDAPAAEAVAADAPDFADRLSILVVDDVAANRELIGAILSPFDVDTTAVGSGPEGVEAACARRFDVILMDLQMPGMDGVAAARAIRANSDLNQATPILAISANVLSDQVEAALDAGLDDHIGKPIDPAELLTKIARWTSRDEDARAQAATSQG